MIQVKGLMIYDWVKAKDIECAQVLSTDRYGYVSLDMQDETKKMCVDFDIEPIPLTEDILKANGFEPNEYGDWIVNKNDYFIGWSMIHKTVRIMTYSPTSGVEQDALVYCTRVHELQRALRCCGLWNLADNFKLE